MDQKEAVAVLEEELSRLRAEPYVMLVGRMATGPITLERAGDSGVTYQLEIQVFWDDRPQGNVRVLGSIDDGGWRAFLPLNRDFIKAPNDTFIGE